MENSDNSYESRFYGLIFCVILIALEGWINESFCFIYHGAVYN